MRIQLHQFITLWSTTLLFYACGSDDTAEDEPTPLGSIEISTSKVTLTALRSVNVEGNITSDGGNEILQRGFSWSEEENPTLQVNQITSGAGSGPFSGKINGLSLNTTYYFKAYAISTTDTVYGNQLELSTSITSAIAMDSTGTQSVQISGIISEELEEITLFSGICWDSIPNPLIKAGGNFPLEAGTFETTINNLKPNTLYYFRSFMIMKEDTLFSKSVTSYTKPMMGPTDIKAVAASYMLYSTTFQASENGRQPLESKGICLSTSPNPTIEDIIIEKGTTIENFRGPKYALTDSTTYFVRAFATNAGGTGYGEESSFTTNEAKKITFSLNMTEEPTDDQEDAYIRITASMNKAVKYYDQYTGWRKHETANYAPGVPTADANNEGWMRFGSNRSYMNVRTTLHEISHTVGIGTSSRFYDLMIDNLWQGNNGNEALRSISGIPNDRINQSGVHIWPQGLNYDSEGTSHQAFVNHCLVMEGMRLDGM